MSFRVLVSGWCWKGSDQPPILRPTCRSTMENRQIQRRSTCHIGSQHYYTTAHRFTLLLAQASLSIVQQNEWQETLLRIASWKKMVNFHFLVLVFCCFGFENRLLAPSLHLLCLGPPLAMVPRSYSPYVVDFADPDYFSTMITICVGEALEVVSRNLNSGIFMPLHRIVASLRGKRDLLLVVKGIGRTMNAKMR